MTCPKQYMKAKELKSIGFPPNVLARMKTIPGIAHKISPGKTSDYFFDTVAMEKQLEKESRLERQIRGLKE